MRVIVEIDCSNDAFQENCADQVARMLAGFSKALVTDGLDDMEGLDTNGNTCATLRVVEEE